MRYSVHTNAQLLEVVGIDGAEKLDASQRVVR